MRELLVVSRRRILLAIIGSLIIGGCGGAVSSDRTGVSGTGISDYTAPKVIGKIDSKDINESSGLAASGCQNDVLWTHNDAGDNAFIYGMNSTGKHLGTWKVQNAQNIDWEDIAGYKDASGKCFLIIGDIGNNELDRSELTIYKVREPGITPADAGSDSKNPRSTEPAQSMRFRYSDGPNNAEAIMVRPGTSDIYILTKRESGPSRIHKLKPAFGSPAPSVTDRIGEITLPAVPIGLLTGGAVSPDGRRVALCDYQQGYELVLPQGISDFDAIWQQKLVVVDLGKRRQGEGVTYTADGNAILASSEKKDAPIMIVERR